MKLSSIESWKVPPSENTPFELSPGGPVTQGKKKKSPPRSLSFQVMVSSILLICFGFTAYTHQSSLSAPSSVVNQSLLKLANKNLYENDSSTIFSATPLTGSELDTDIASVSLSDEETENKVTNTENGQPGLYFDSRLYPVFPSNVYEYSETNVGNSNYMRRIGERCGRIKDKTMDEQLACFMYFGNPGIASQQVPFALGTLKTNADIYDITINGGLKQGDVSMLFKDYALAAMIDAGCFMWSTENGSYKETSYSFITEKDYKNAASKSTSIEASGSASYWGVTVSAGYESASSVSSSDGKSTRTAFGERKYNAPVGTIRNKCFQSPQNFQEVITKLVKLEWANRWEKIRNATTVNEVLALGDDFEKVADGGFFMPTRYQYEVMIANTLTTEYTSSSAGSTKSAAKAISAGLTVDFVAAGGTAEVAIKERAESASAEGGYTSTVNVKTIGSGNGIDIECMYKTEGIGACSTVIVEAVDRIRNDITQLGEYPSSQSVFLTLNELVEWYFNDGKGGLPDVFRQAVKRRYPNKPVFMVPDKTLSPTMPPTRKPPRPTRKPRPTTPPCKSKGWTETYCTREMSPCFIKWAMEKPSMIPVCLREVTLKACKEACECCPYVYRQN